MIQAVLPLVNGPESPLVSSTAAGDKAASKLVLLLFIDFCIISFNIIRRRAYESFLMICADD